LRLKIYRRRNIATFRMQGVKESKAITNISIEKRWERNYFQPDDLDSLNDAENESAELSEEENCSENEDDEVTRILLFLLIIKDL